MRGYGVLEANAKVNGIGENSHPCPSQILSSIWMAFQINHYVPQRVDVQSLSKVDSAVAALRMREKISFVCFLLTHLSIYPLFATPTGHIFSGAFNA